MTSVHNWKMLARRIEDELGPRGQMTKTKQKLTNNLITGKPKRDDDRPVGVLCFFRVGSEGPVCIIF